MDLAIVNFAAPAEGTARPAAAKNAETPKK